MDANTPPPLTLEDLDRAELSRGLQRNAHRLRQSHLLCARHDVASRRSREAFERETEAATASFDCTHARIKACAAGKATSAAALGERARPELARATASCARQRADAATERAWTNLQACWTGGH